MKRYVVHFPEQTIVIEECHRCNTKSQAEFVASSMIEADSIEEEL